MARFWEIFDQTQKVARLQRERDESFDRANDLETRLFREIDSNRRREDALTAAIVELAGGSRIPSRDEIGDELPKRKLPEADVEKTDEEKADEAAFEARVAEAVEGFIQNARDSHMAYADDPDYRSLLEAKIRANPDEYLEN